MRPALTEYMIKNAAPRQKKYYLSDGMGLMLEVNPNGSKYWIMRIYANKKEIRRSLGIYPDTTLKQARKKAMEMKLSNNVSFDSDMTFEQAFSRYYDFHYSRLCDKHRETIDSRWNNYIKPAIGHMRLNRITSHNIVVLCQGIIKAGHYETAKRIKTIISQVFRFAVAQNIIQVDPTSALSSILPTKPAKHFATLTEPDEISMLMKSIDAYPHRLVRLALLFSARTFCRPGEIRFAEWQEIDTKTETWTIRGEKMKMKRDHIVPLSTQNLELLQELQTISGGSKWIFPSARSLSRPISEGTLRVALRTMGYTNEQMTPHGFRSMASTVLNTYDWPRDYIELQLAHVDSSVRGIYNRSLYLTQRKAMMQWWSDYLDSRKADDATPSKPALQI